MKVRLLLLVMLCAAVTNLRVDRLCATGVVPEEMAAEKETRGTDLGVVMIRTGDDPRPLVAPGQQITLGVGVGNLNGDSDAHSVVLTVRLPSGIMLLSARPAPNKVEGPSLVWNLGTVAAHAFPQTFDLNLAVAKDVASELAVSADVTSSEGEQHTENSTDSLLIVVKPAAADVIVQSTLGTVALTFGEPVKFSVSVSNQGNVAASAILLSVVLPPKVSFTASDPAPSATDANTATWQLGDIAPAASRTVTITVTLNQSLAPAWLAEPDAAGALSFVFDGATTAAQMTPAHNHLEITKRVERAGPDLQVWINVQGAHEPGELPVGKDVKYVIGYGNFGNRPATGVRLSLSLSEGLTFLGAEPKPGGTERSDRFGGGVMSWNVGDLGVGDSDTVTANVHVTSVPDDGSLSMATIASPRGMDIDPRNDVAYADLRAQGAASRGAPTQGGDTREPQAQGGKAGEPQTRGGSTSGGGRGGHAVRNLSLAGLALAAVIWAVRRASRRDNASK